MTSSPIDLMLFTLGADVCGGYKVITHYNEKLMYNSALRRARWCFKGGLK